LSAGEQVLCTKKNIIATDTFKENRLKFTVAEFLNIHFAGRNAKTLGNLGRQFVRPGS
jgi:hypothetical protein